MFISKTGRARPLIAEEPGIPALMDPLCAPWSIGLADFLYQHQPAGVRTDAILKQRPGGHTETKTRQCLAFLDLAGCAMYQRGVWRLSAYGLAWRERQDRTVEEPLPLLAEDEIDDTADLSALADAAALQAEVDAGHHVLREAEPKSKPARRRSDARIADEALQETLHARIQTFDGSTSLQVSAILRVLTASNVVRLMELMPDSFRPTFVSWCCRHYLFVPDDVERITLVCGVGVRGMAAVARQDMQESIAAICGWLIAVADDENSADQDVCQAVAAARQEAASRRASSSYDDAWMAVT